MKRTNLCKGTQPASLFMHKRIVFEDLVNTRLRQIDPLEKPKQADAGGHRPISKRHLHLY